MIARDIIEIDEEKCDGCGNCVIACAEGALEIREGKARIVKEILALSNVREIRIKPKEIRVKKEEYSSWGDIEDRVSEILNRALRRKKIRLVKS